MVVERIKQTKLESMMTARDVADFLGVSICSIRRWSKAGALNVYKVGANGQMRFRVDDVLRFLEKSSPQISADSAHRESPAYTRNGDRTTASEARKPVCSENTEVRNKKSRRKAPGQLLSKINGGGIFSIIESTADTFAILDNKLNFAGMNPAGEKLLGLTEEAVVGRSLRDFAPELRETGRYKGFLNVAKKKQPFLVDRLVLQTKGGRELMNVRAFSIEDGVGIIATKNGVGNRNLRN